MSEPLTPEHEAEIRAVNNIALSLTPRFTQAIADGPILLAEIDRLREGLAEMTRLRDNAMRFSQRDHIDDSVWFDIEGVCADVVASLNIEWDDDRTGEALAAAIASRIGPVLANTRERAEDAEAKVDRAQALADLWKPMGMNQYCGRALAEAIAPQATPSSTEGT